MHHSTRINVSHASLYSNILCLMHHYTRINVSHASLYSNKLSHASHTLMFLMHHSTRIKCLMHHSTRIKCVSCITHSNKMCVMHHSTRINCLMHHTLLNVSHASLYSNILCLMHHYTRINVCHASLDLLRLSWIAVDAPPKESSTQPFCWCAHLSAPNIADISIFLLSAKEWGAKRGSIGATAIDYIYIYILQSIPSTAIDYMYIYIYVCVCVKLRIGAFLGYFFLHRLMNFPEFIFYSSFLHGDRRQGKFNRKLL